MEGFDDASYGDRIADVYDEWYEDLGDVDALIALLESFAPSGRFLELGVGTGRLALPLAGRGVRITGVDSSASMIARLRAKDSSGCIEVIEGDMVNDLPDAEFDVVFVAYNTLFSLRSAERQGELFAAAARRLAPRGRFVVEAFVPDSRPAGGTVGVRTLTADRVVLTADLHDPAAQTIDGQFIEFTESHGVRLRPFSLRYSTPAELDAQAERAGLRLVDRWQDARRRPFSSDSATHVSVYGRP